MHALVFLPVKQSKAKHFGVSFKVLSGSKNLSDVPSCRVFFGFFIFYYLHYFFFWHEKSQTFHTHEMLNSKFTLTASVFQYMDFPLWTRTIINM